MARPKASVKSDGWTLFDRIVSEAPLRDVNPWTSTGGPPTYKPDYETLKLLLRVPAMLASTSTSGIPALALDVWIAYELRRAGFESDAVWPRPDTPRILPGPIAGLLSSMGKSDAARLRELLASGNTFGGTVGASAKVLGKNYMKQVDVVMSDWDTGPEILISTKRMDDSFGNNAPNRIEESYGDAKNLRSRHPRAALGFLFGLRSTAFDQAPRVAAWISDLLAKLGREDDAYDAVALIVPRYPDPPPGDVDAPEPEEDDQTALIEAELVHGADYVPVSMAGAVADALYLRLCDYPAVELVADVVPLELDPGRFLGIMSRHVLDNSPITRHERARDLLKAAGQ